MSVGLVPTMGALHEGHRSLVRRARAECDRVVVSVFVNPRQFAPGEDYERYPRSLDDDIAMLAEQGVHAVYAPGVEAMYPPGSATSVRVTGPAGERLEAERRAGHFDGVALVVAKLFIAARPDRAYFGAKDAQQCAVVRRLAADLDTGVEVVVCPTVRDHDGLALSSRNAYLNEEERCRALAIPRGLAAAARRFDDGEHDPGTLIGLVQATLDEAGIATDYVAIVDGDAFSDCATASPGCQILVAGRIGTTRLIDCLRLGIDESPQFSDAHQQTECSGSS